MKYTTADVTRFLIRAMDMVQFNFWWQWNLKQEQWVGFYSNICCVAVHPHRESKEVLDYQDLQGRPDWPVCLDLGDPWGHLDHPDQAIAWVL